MVGLLEESDSVGTGEGQRGFVFVINMICLYFYVREAHKLGKFDIHPFCYGKCLQFNGCCCGNGCCCSCCDSNTCLSCSTHSTGNADDDSDEMKKKTSSSIKKFSLLNSTSDITKSMRGQKFKLENR
eukprot:UN33084